MKTCSRSRQRTFSLLAALVMMSTSVLAQERAGGPGGLGPPPALPAGTQVLPDLAYVPHGDQDPLVPHHQSELLAAALKQAGVPVMFYMVKGAGHGFHDATADKLMFEHFAKYLKPPKGEAK
jgi:acetyl esterase/lipase